ncbi:MAG: hypothetical protein KatS3mg027_1081 [Bacteroidia bacterium]|nr:MAG: hypothetical protein KatS3mg027_1081 [Bacteroidia bacterium]
MSHTLLYSIKISAIILITHLVLITFIFNLLKPQRIRSFLQSTQSIFCWQFVSELCGTLFIFLVPIVVKYNL